MYEAYYGFKEKPFSMLPDPGFLYLSKKHQAAMTLLEYGLLNNVGFCVVSGEPGAGKTTILRAMLDKVANDITVGLITNTHQSFGGLLDWVLSAFDLHKPNLTHVEMHQLFVEFLIEEYANKRTVLLVVDEAQNMKADALEELRMLSNVNSEKDQLMQVVLAGQPGLRDTLKLPELSQFAQRISVDYHIEPLSVEETCGYIQHRLVTAGATRDVFTPAACERIYTYSGGSPRLINLLCETVLVYGFADQQEIIDVDLVDEMVQERMKDSVVPIVNRDAFKHDNAAATEELARDFPWIRPDGGTQGLKPGVSEVEESSPVPVPVVESTAKLPAGSDKAQLADTDQIPVVEPEKNTLSKAVAENLHEAQESEQVQDVRPEVNRSASAKDNRVSIEQYRAALIDDEPEEEAKGNHSLLVMGLVASLIAVVIVVLVGSYSDIENYIKQYSNKDELIKMQQQRDAERKEEQARMDALRRETEKLKKQRDAAIAKAEAEKQAKLEAERLAAEKAQAEEAARQVEAARVKEEQKRLAAEKEKQRVLREREAKARAEAARIKREAKRLEQERHAMELKLAEQKRLQQEEARRLELEWQQNQLEEQRLRDQQNAKAAADAEARLAAEEAARKVEEEAKKLPPGCQGPAAKFKTGCR